MYTSPLALMKQYGVPRLAKYASPIDSVNIKITPGPLLYTVITGGDVSGFSNEQRELAAQSLIRIEDSITAAESAVNAYLVRRYQVPLSEQLLTANIKLIRRHTNAIARYMLAAHKMNAAIELAYNDSISWLDDITNGVKGGLSLGDTSSNQPPIDGVTRPMSIKQFESKVAWPRYRLA
jgi:phage gp36-like protein